MYHVDENGFEFAFKCAPRMKRSSLIQLHTNSRVQPIVQLTRIANENIIRCNAWVNSLLVFTVNVPYIKDVVYNLQYNYKLVKTDKHKDPIVVGNKDFHKIINYADMEVIKDLFTFNDFITMGHGPLTVYGSRISLTRPHFRNLKNTKSWFCKHEWEYFSLDLGVREIIDTSTWQCKKCGKLRKIKINPNEKEKN